MSSTRMDERLASLEKRLAELEALVTMSGQLPDWRRTVGLFQEDDLWRRIDDAGRRIREAERRKARRPPAKRKRAKT